MKKMVLGTLAVFMVTSVILTTFPLKQASALLLPIIMMYENAKEKGEKSPLGHTEETEKNSLPASGESSLSSKDLVRNGKVVQRRYYDAKGQADVDIDYDHSNGDGTHTFPHRHKWTWKDGKGTRGPGY